MACGRPSVRPSAAAPRTAAEGPRRPAQTEGEDPWRGRGRGRLSDSESVQPSMVPCPGPAARAGSYCTPPACSAVPPPNAPPPGLWGDDSGAARGGIYPSMRPSVWDPIR
eukprot:scaffold3841_cov412-Prasinococcus_capsulatus_cf.AAC.13